MEKQKIIVLGSAGNLGMYFIDHLMNELDREKYEIVATGRQNKPKKENSNGRRNLKRDAPRAEHDKRDRELR